MNGVISILYDIILEARETASTMEYDDPKLDSFQYIEDLASVAITKLEEAECP